MDWGCFQGAALNRYDSDIFLITTGRYGTLLTATRYDHRIVIRIEGAITCGFQLKAKLATSLKATLL